MAEPLAQRLRPPHPGGGMRPAAPAGPGQGIPPHTGKRAGAQYDFLRPLRLRQTTVARIIAENSGMRLHKLNGTSASTSDIKAVLAEIGTLQSAKGLLLYLDEIQYLNKKQQQSLLECIEDGSVTLIASTTENPYFYIYNALLSRCTVFEFKALNPADIRTGLNNAVARLEQEDGVPLQADEDALDYLAQSAGGDMRKALGCLEFAVAAAPEEEGTRRIHLDMVQQVARRTAMRYDRDGDDHYDILSAYQKSMARFRPGRRRCTTWPACWKRGI